MNKQINDPQRLQPNACFWSYLYLLHALCYRSWLGLCCASVLLEIRLIGAAGKIEVPPHQDTCYRKSSSLGWALTGADVLNIDLNFCSGFSDH